MYTDIGYIKISEARRLVYAYNSVRPILITSADVRNVVNDIFTAALYKPDKNRWHEFGDSDMSNLGLAAVTGRVAAVNAHVYTMMHVLLGVCNRSNTIPPKLDLRYDPSMSIGEAIYVTALSKIDVAKFKNYLPNSNTPIMAADISDAIYLMMLDLDNWLNTIESMEIKMLSLISHIKHKIMNSVPIDAFEKTLYLHASHSIYGTEIGQNGKVARKTMGDAAVPFETGDVLVFTFMEQLKAACLPGPKFSYLPLISNASQESLFVSYGPHPVKAITAAGFILNFPPYVKLDLKVLSAVPIEVTDDMHLLGLMTQSMSASGAMITKPLLGLLRGNSSMTYKWNLHVQKIPRTVFGSSGKVTKSISTPMIMDIPEVDLIWANNKVQYKFNSEILGRTVIATDPDILIYELALKHKVFGGTHGFRSSIDEFSYVDLNRIVDVALATSTMKFICVLYRNGGVKEEEVDMSHYFINFGDKLIRPAFNDMLIPPILLLEKPQEAAVDYICLIKQMTRFEKMMSSRAITICYNSFLLLSFFNKLPVVGSLTTGRNQMELIRDFAKTQLYRKDV